MTNTKSILEVLVDDTVLTLLSSLDVTSIVRFGSTSKAANLLANDAYLWTKKLAEDFNFVIPPTYPYPEPPVTVYQRLKFLTGKVKAREIKNSPEAFSSSMFVLLDPSLNWLLHQNQLSGPISAAQAQFCFNETCRIGNANLMRDLIAGFAKPDEHGLCLAATYGHVVAAKILVEESDVLPTFAVLNAAAGSGNLELFTYLINTFISKANCGLSPGNLFQSHIPSIVDAAVSSGNELLIEQLFVFCDLQGISLDEVDEVAVLIEAAKLGNKRIYDLITKHLTVSLSVTQQSTILDNAASSKNTSFYQTLSLEFARPSSRRRISFGDLSAKASPKNMPGMRLLFNFSPPATPHKPMTPVRFTFDECSFESDPQTILESIVLSGDKKSLEWMEKEGQAVPSKAMLDNAMRSNNIEFAEIQLRKCLQAKINPDCQTLLHAIRMGHESLVISILDAMVAVGPLSVEDQILATLEAGKIGHYNLTKRMLEQLIQANLFSVLVEQLTPLVFSPNWLVAEFYINYCHQNSTLSPALHRNLSLEMGEILKPQNFVLMRHLFETLRFDVTVDLINHTARHGNVVGLKMLLKISALSPSIDTLRSAILSGSIEAAHYLMKNFELSVSQLFEFSAREQYENFLRLIPDARILNWLYVLRLLIPTKEWFDNVVTFLKPEIVIWLMDRCGIKPDVATLRYIDVASELYIHVKNRVTPEILPTPIRYDLNELNEQLIDLQMHTPPKKGRTAQELPKRVPSRKHAKVEEIAEEASSAESVDPQPSRRLI